MGESDGNERFRECVCMTEGKNGKQLSDEEEINGGFVYEGPCPICGLFHEDFCKMEEVLR